MIITDIRYHPYRVPFKRPFTTAHGTLTAREGVIVELVTDAGVSGYGDMAAVTEFGAPDVATLIRAARTMEPRVIGMNPKDIRYRDGNWLDIFPGPLMFALEAACNNASSREFWRNYRYRPPLYHPRLVPINATIGDLVIADACSTAHNAVVAGFTCIKLKVGMLDTPKEEIARVRAVREVVGMNVHLRLDANESWSYDKALVILSQLKDCALQFVEQPLSREDLVGSQMLRHELGIPIAADEALLDAASIQDVLKTDAVDVLILKPQLLGGMYAVDVIMHQCKGKSIVLTTSLESGIGVADTLIGTDFFIRRSSSVPILECGLSTLSLLEDDLIQADLPIENGYMRIPQKRTEPDWDALARYHLDVEDV